MKLRSNKIIEWGCFLLLFCGAIMLSGCETLAQTQTSTVRVQKNELTPRNLASGDCGLFVWAGEAREFILFTQASERAQHARGEDDISLTALDTEAAGDLYGQIPVQSFTDAKGLKYDLNLSSPEPLDGGIRYKSGTWRYKNSEGWDVLTPVYGLSTCQP